MLLAESNSKGKSLAVSLAVPELRVQSSPQRGRKRRVQRDTSRVRRDGKFFRLGDEKFYVRGVTYGPFAANSDGELFPSRDQTRADFEQTLRLGANCVRVYHNPPRWFLDLAQETGVKVFIDVAWPKNLCFSHDESVKQQARDAVRKSAHDCGQHPATFAISVVNEMPPDIVRFCGAKACEDFIDELVSIAKHEAPQCLLTFANFPTTEYLRPRNIDFACFNVYLHDQQVFRNYLARLQNIAGELPLMLGEYGIDTHREHSEESQAQILANHVRAAFDEGLVGTFIFSFTDEWVKNGYRIDDWKFGIVRADRSEKPAFAVIQNLFKIAPQTAQDVKLPMVSVVICSYNGASTVESCLNSLRKMRYPEYEVIFVDDGSTDQTQEILKKFPWVRNIHQRNMGLSHARNIGLNAARGEIVVYTDSDCEADEDWLYYLALALVRSTHAGIGGPNLIPDEGSWIADCVGLSPGGPTHIMIDDRTAEHVPGCNMAFYTHVARQANGFDPQFRSAGDDVDFIWRLQHMGYTIGFAPSAQVWHYRRNTVAAYLKQQRGYGHAEAMLKYKHPDHFNTLGASHWRGKIYGGDQIGLRFGGDVIYHGVFGTGLFQTIYRKEASLTAMMLQSIEWHLLAGFIAVLGLAFLPLMWVALVMFIVPMIIAIAAAIQSPRPKHSHWLTRPLIAFLHWRQPLARGWARYAARLRNKVLKHEARGYRRAGGLPFDPADRSTLRYWSHPQDRIALLEKIKEEVAAAGWRMRADSGWSGYDMEIFASRYVKVRITSASEQHDGGFLTRVRVQFLMSKFGMVIMAGCCMLAGLLLLHLWPFSRPAVLIPLAWWTMYCINRWRVSSPVLGLIDAAAEDANFYPIYPVAHDPARYTVNFTPEPTSQSESKPSSVFDDDVEDAVIA